MNYIILLVFCSPLSISSPFSWFSCGSDTLSSLFLFVFLSFSFLYFVCLCVCVCTRACSVAQLCPTLCDPVDCSLPGSSVHGVFHAEILEWAILYSSKWSSGPWDWTCISCISCIGFFTTALSYFFGFTRSFRLILYISCHSLQISYLSNEHWFFFWRQGYLKPRSGC